jgi:flavorubredoxin
MYNHKSISCWQYCIKYHKGLILEESFLRACYGWSGEAARLVFEILKDKFGMNVTEPPLSVIYTPDQAGLKKCFALGKRVAESLIHKG